jgi:FAD/FMN-containing dehydrogenase
VALNRASGTRQWQALERAIDGEILRPGAPGYEAARRPAIARFQDVRPAAVVRCRTPEDVATTLAFGMPAVPRSGGHCFAGRSTSGGVVIDVGPMDAVSVSGGTATIGAGARLGRVYDALDAHGVTIPAGCGPEVGIAGLTLGGGLGILGRLHGLTCDSLLAAQVVLPDGRIVECDEQREPELFWALRGSGGGHFGVVTSFTFRTLVPPAATAFDLRWPLSEAPALIAAWQAAELPDEVAASVLVGEDAKLFGAALLGEADTVAALARFGDAESAAFHHGSYREVKRHLAGDGGVDHRHPYCKSEFFRRPLPAEAIEALIDHLEPGGELDFSPWGGAYNRVPADATAFPHRQERFLLKHAVNLEPDAPVEPARRWLQRSWELVHPYGSGGSYVNFPDPGLEDELRAYWGSNHDRLVAFKRSLGG